MSYSFPALDYSIQSPEERLAFVNTILSQYPPGFAFSPQYLETLSDYLVFSMTKQERQTKQIITENRAITIHRRETSLEALALNEITFYPLITDQTKEQILCPKSGITQEDLETIPPLRQLHDTIEAWEDSRKRRHPRGREAYIYKKAVIEMRKDQYIIKQAYKPSCAAKKIMQKTNFGFQFNDTSYIDENNEIVFSGVTLMDPAIVQIMLQYYSQLKQDSIDDFISDTYYLIMTLEEVADQALANQPVLQRILELKIDGARNSDIQLALIDEFNLTHSAEYISALWRKKIPKVIAEQAQRIFLMENYPRDLFKQCTQCHQLKPMHRLFFTKNGTSADGLYSICKDCRKKKRG